MNETIIKRYVATFSDGTKKGIKWQYDIFDLDW